MIRIDVDGKPIPQGSMNAVPFHKPCLKCAQMKRYCGRQRMCIGGRELAVNVMQSEEVKVWRYVVALQATMALKRAGFREFPAWPEGPVAVCFLFRLQRPQYHVTARGALSSDGERNLEPWHKPDLDKLVRSGLDAMTGVVYTDDGQVVAGPTTKIYAPIGKNPSVTILVAPRTPDLTNSRLGAELDALLDQPAQAGLFG